MIDSMEIVERIRRIQGRIRDTVLDHIDRSNPADLSDVVDETAGDTIYDVDRIGEVALMELFDVELAETLSFVLIGEGLPEEGVTVPSGTPPRAPLYESSSIRSTVRGV